jgi:hypothetical protein
VLNEDGAATEDFPDVCLTACLDALRDADVCAAFVRLHRLLNTPLGEQLTRHPLTENGLTVSIDLALPAQRAWAAMSRGHTNAINRANRAGFRVEISPAGQRVDEFTAAYTDTLQRLGAAETYHFSDEYFARLAARTRRSLRSPIPTTRWRARTCSSRATALSRCTSAAPAPSSANHPRRI